MCAHGLRGKRDYESVRYPYQSHGTAASPDRCVRASPEHWDDQSVEGNRPDAKIVVPTKNSEQEPTPCEHVSKRSEHTVMMTR